MAYAFDPSLDTEQDAPGKTWLIQETELTPAGEWSISGLPRRVTITLLTANLVTPGTASTLQPELGYRAGWTSGEEGHISQAAAASADHVIGTKVHAYLPEGKLYGRSVPDTGGGASSVARTRITIEPGHT